MAESETTICNQALSEFGSTRINDFNDNTESSAQAIQCRLHYEPVRDALIRSHYWRFASDRAALSQDTVDPDFEFDNQFILPSDFLRLKSIFGDNSTATGNTRITFAIEDDRLLTNESTVQLRYIKKVTNPVKFDPLFVELFVLTLALKMIGPLAGTDVKLQTLLQQELRLILPGIRALDRQETNTIGRESRRPWLESRLNGGSLARQLR